MCTFFQLSSLRPIKAPICVISLCKNNIESKHLKVRPKYLFGFFLHAQNLVTLLLIAGKLVLAANCSPACMVVLLKETHYSFDSGPQQHNNNIIILFLGYMAFYSEVIAVCLQFFLCFHRDVIVTSALKSKTDSESQFTFRQTVLS